VSIRFRHKPVQLSPDHVLFPYWGVEGFFRPTVEVLLRGPDGAVRRAEVLVDSGSPYIVFDEEVARDLGLGPPFPRRATGLAAGGGEVTVGFPEDGEVTVFLSDFRGGFYAWQPLVGFLAARQGQERTTQAPVKQTAPLGFTGFFQHFDVTFPDGPDGPAIEVTHKANLPGLHGGWPPPRDLWARLGPSRGGTAGR
jgi:hypothetical protein